MGLTPDLTPTTHHPPPDAQPLQGLRVYDLADESGFICGRILADLGADVVKVEPPGGDPARWLPPFADDQPGPDRGLNWLVGNANKRAITCNVQHPDGRALFRQLAERADVVLETLPPGEGKVPGLGYEELSERNPGLILTSISPFGKDGPRADWLASDLEITAASGSLWLAGDPQKPPVRTTLPMSSGWSGMSAAMGTLIAVVSRDVTGRGQHVDVSAQTSLVMAISHAPCFLDLLGENPTRSGPFLSGRSVSGANFRNIWPCRDGYVTFALYGGLAGRETGRSMVAWMEERGGAPEAIKRVDWDKFDVATVTPETVAELEAAIGPFLLGLSKVEFFEGVIQRNMLGYPAATVEDIWNDQQLKARDFWAEVGTPWSDERIYFPGSFALFDGVRPAIRRTTPKIGEHNGEIYGELGINAGGAGRVEQEGRDLSEVTETCGRGDAEGREPSPRPPASGGSPHPPIPPSPHLPSALAGLRVVELGGFAAGPVVGKHLANHGAEVIRIESRTRLDGFRTHYPPFKDNIPGPERAAIFNFFNDSKRSLTLNLKLPAGVELARKLVTASDVVVENFTPGTMARLGLDYELLSQDNPRLVMLSTCNQGQFGPHATHPGFGTHLTSLSGFTQLLGYPDDTPALLYGPYVDYIAVGYGTIAVLAGLVQRRRTGLGVYIDLSQYEAGLQFMAPALLDLFANGRVASRDGNRDPSAAPHGVFPCRPADGDERWCAISVGDDDQWRRFVEAIGSPDWATDTSLSTHQGRKAQEDRLEAVLAEWTRGRERDEIVALLQQHGVRAHPVNSMVDLFADPQLQHRQHWRPVDHSVLGRVHVAAPPFLLSDAPSEVEHAAPLLGQDNEYVLSKILGLSKEQIRELEADGVLE